jgi:hypothetical protein
MNTQTTVDGKVMKCNYCQTEQEIIAWSTPLHEPSKEVDFAICRNCWNDGKRFPVFDLETQKYI